MKRLPRIRRRWLVVMVLTVILLLAAATTGILYRQPQFAIRRLAGWHPDVLFYVKTRQPAVGLTIDDGPHAGITPRILDVLQQYDVRATFFVLGDHIPGNELLLERMRSEGHELGNHLAEDRPSILLPNEEFARQLAVVDPWIQATDGVKWFRPGSGWFDDPMLEQARELGYHCCLGSIFPHDDKIHAPQWLADEVLKRVYPGAIIILHDGQDERASVVETLERLLPELLERGYSVMTVSELVGLE